jgi:hypothetical protein
MTKGELLRMLRAERGEWEQLLALAPLSQAEQPMQPGGWSLRDLIAHLVWYEQECLALCRTGVVAQPGMWGQPEDELNATIRQAAQQVPASALLATMRSLFVEITGWLEKVEPALLAEPVAYPGEQPYPHWHHIWENSYDHYREHLDDMRSWLESGR